MPEKPTSRPASEPAVENSADSSGSLEELRHLILAPEQEALERLHNRVDNLDSRTKDVGSVVAEAIQLRRKQGGDGALSDALAPTIETALRESVRKDPATLADALFPVMGPAIRRSILETLRSFMESFNQIMDQSLSWQGMKWRMEALQTGRTFTEVVLLHSLVFRVEQVFLIHRTTGLPIEHVVASSVAMQDPSMVSGMLSAIQDFVKDSFHAETGQGVNRLNVGDLDVWVEEGPYAILACVIRGVPPRVLRDNMAEVLENIHREYSQQLDRFDGDSAPFTKVHDELSRCLEFKYKEEPAKKSNRYALLAGGVLLALVLGWIGLRWWQQNRWSQFVEDLRERPGFAVTSFDREHGRFVIRGLRDPLAGDPVEVLKSHGLDPAKAEFHWGGYYALDDAIVQQRAMTTLGPPAGVMLSVKDGVLGFAGKPPAAWVKDFWAKALRIPGIRAVNVPDEYNPERLSFNEGRNEIQGAVVRFPVGSATLGASERAALRALIVRMKNETQAAAALRQSMAIEIIGHSDTSGAETTNETLSQRRAERVAAELSQMGITGASIHPKGVAASEPVRPEDTEENRQLNRSVTFRVVSQPLS
jgi:outer membrane protein OmpA-like peptidoglycan-associated protein